MHRPSFALAAALAFVAATAVVASAATPPSGTIACDVDPTSPLQFAFIPYIQSTPGPSIGVKVPMAGPCDNSNVVGGKAPITHVETSIRGRLEEGSVCTTVVSPGFPYDKLKIKLKWRSFDGVRFKTVATSTTHLSAGTYDAGSESIVFTSEIFRGAFAGTISTISLKLQDPSFMSPNCPAIGGLNWLGGGASTLAVQ